MDAVIGANAVVRHDVLPFEIVCGVPAKRIRFRFPEEIQKRILASCWWDWPVETLIEALPDMQAMEIGEFLDKWEYYKNVS